VHLKISDPGRVGLRRATRAAIGTPIALVLSLTLLPDTPGPVLAAFGTISLLGAADFGGSIRRRTTSILSTGVAGALLIPIGVLAASHVISAVVVTFLVTGTLAFLVALRGTFASACPSLTTIYIASVMVATSTDAITPMIAGWGIAIAVSLPVTLLILPRRNLAPVRAACATAMGTLSDAIQRRAQGEDLDQAPIRAALTQLQASYLGNPFRAAGLNHSDRALIILVGQIETLLVAMTRGDEYSRPISALPLTRDLITASGGCLEEQARALTRDLDRPPSSQRLVEVWNAQWDSAVATLGDTTYGDAGERVRVVNHAFVDRAMAIAVVRLGILVRRVLRQPEETFAPSQHTIPEPPQAHPWKDLASQLTLQSPWLRTALRTGIALALASLVVEVMGIAHGIWVMLGVVATLRLDGIATLRTSLLAVVGTFGGVLLGYGLLEVDGTHRGFLWMTLFVVAFLAVYTQATTAYVIGQAAFSLFVIVSFTLITWPPDLRIVDQRFTDIVIGAAISALVALLMWPHGVASGLRSNVADAITQGAQLLRNATANLLRGPGHVTAAELSRMSGAFSRSMEVVEVTLSSRAPGAVDRAHAWEEVIGQLRTLTVSGHLINQWSQDAAPIQDIVPALVGPIQSDCDSAVDAWDRVARIIEGQTPGDPIAEPDFLAMATDIAADADLTSTAVADRMVGAIWTHGWIRTSLSAANSTEVPAPPR
jgi:uncharacterized membrane protein YccC